jgi:hypothetical protein
MSIRWNRRKYTKEEFINAWNSYESIEEAIRQLDLSPYGSTYNTMNDTANELGLTRKHMTGQGWNVGDKFGLIKRNTIPLDEILIEDSTYSNGAGLKKKLFAAGLFERKCYRCNLKEWMGEPIPIQLEHINGVHNDNRIDNLTLLCPNCHAQTPTYCGKNIGKSNRSSQ